MNKRERKTTPCLIFRLLNDDAMRVTRLIELISFNLARAAHVLKKGWINRVGLYNTDDSLQDECLFNFF